MHNVELNKLSLVSRVTRIILGVSLIAFTMSFNGVLGAFAVLPLLAVYPILSGVFGYGVLSGVISKARGNTSPAVKIIGGHAERTA